MIINAKEMLTSTVLRSDVARTYNLSPVTRREWPAATYWGLFPVLTRLESCFLVVRSVRFDHALIVYSVILLAIVSCALRRHSLFL
jgi:hypothetical protein